MPVTHDSFCRVCTASCRTLVDVEDGHIVRILGDSSDPLYRGYTCVKGRTTKDLYAHQARLTHALKRRGDGSLTQIPLEEAFGEIAEKLRMILDRDGPSAVGLFWGSPAFLDNVANATFIDAFMAALGSDRLFDSTTIDQPGKAVAKGFHGAWMAPDISTVEPDVALVVGNNTLVSHQGRIGVPSDLPRDLHARGGSLIVIDPRVSELARRADIHLQSLPGTDPIVLAGLLRVILDEELQDQAFVDAEVEGLDELRATVAAFTPDRVADLADIDADDLVKAARIFGRGRKAYATAGTGPNMTGRGTLVEYLILCLDTVLGHRPRAGELISRDPCLSPLSAVPAIAQASGSFQAYEIGEPLRGSGMYRSAAGFPAGAMAGEILAPGGIRALLSTGGNPASCLPGQQDVIRALESLELLVHTDVQMAATSQLAHYVIPALLPYEMHGMSLSPEFAGMYGNGLGYAVPYAQYTDPVIDPPVDSECMSQWEIFFRLGQRMGLQFELHPAFGRLVPGGTPTKIDMRRVPDLEEIYDIVFAGTRVPWREVRDARRGIFDATVRTVAPKQPGWEARLNVGHPVMMADLTALLTLEAPDSEFPLVLIPRRSKRVMNTPTIALPKGARNNPIWVHPKDLASCGLHSGDLIEVESAVGSVLGIAESDDTLRPGVISMSHQFGELPSRDENEIRRVGTSVNWLLANSTANDRYSGQPQMSNVPVRIGPVG